VTRTFRFLATVAAIGVVPQVAHASCSGTACNAFSAVANFSASDRRVNATLTNKDATNAIHLKFCINVEFHCNGFDVVLHPHETVTKSALFAGQKPPQKYAVDVVTAEFAGQNVSGANVLTVDTPRGPFTYFAAKEPVVSPWLTKAVAAFSTAESSYTAGREHADKAEMLAQKLMSIKFVEEDVRAHKGTHELTKTQAQVAKGADFQIKLAASLMRTLRNAAKSAEENVTFTQNDLNAASDEKAAKDLMAEAEKQQKIIDGLFKVISLGYEVADKVATGAVMTPLAVKSALEAGDKIIAAFKTNSLIRDAEELQKKADQIRWSNATAKLKQAKEALRELQDTIPNLERTLADLRQYGDSTWSTAEDMYDKNTKGRFNFGDLKEAIEETETTVELARKAAEAAYGTREALQKLRQAGGNDVNSWMAAPREDLAIIDSMYSAAGEAFNWSVKTRPRAELLLKQLQEAYAKARDALQ